MEIDHTYLIKSILFNSILKSYEIRYSDFLAYILEKTNNISIFHNVQKKQSTFEILRENMRSDILIKVDGVPAVIIENKLQSYPNSDQLEEYSKKFIKKVSDELKLKIKNENNHKKFNNKVKEDSEPIFKQFYDNAKFYLLLPFTDSAYKVPEMEFRYEINDFWNPRFFKKLYSDSTILNSTIKKKWYKNIKIKIIWQIMSYEQLGERLSKIEIPSQNENIKVKPDIICLEQILHLNYLKTDFSNILLGFHKLTGIIKEIKPDRKLNVEISDGIEKFEKLKIVALYKKLKASKLANHLYENLRSAFPGNEFHIRSSWNREKIGENEIIVSHNYSSKGHEGLFETIKRINPEIIFIIQVEGTTLKKGIYIEGLVDKNSKIKKSSWFKEHWNIKAEKTGFKDIIFNVKNNKECYQYDQGNGCFLFYSAVNISEFTIEEIVSMYKKYLFSQDNLTIGDFDQ